MIYLRFHSASLGRDKTSFASALASTNVCKAGLEKVGDTDARRRIITPGFKKLSIEEQCRILGLSRSTYYYRPKQVEPERNLEIMKVIDEQFRLMNLMDLYAIIDVYSRYIVGWGLYNSLDASNAIEVLDAAVRRHGAPEIINSDQGIDHQIPAARYAAAIAA